MRTTIERVRTAVLAGVVAVLLVLGGVLGYAHWRTHRLIHDLPQRLGADIEKETNGFTYSQSVKGRTVFTIHAARATQRKDGRTGLHDVAIVVYGRGSGEQVSERADRIYGKEFEYDAKSGVVRAAGEVELDLQAPLGAGSIPARGGAPGPRKPAGDGAVQPIHVKTSGLVFVQSLGVASTDQPIQFSYHGLNGQARGASYSADTGVTTLESEVRLTGVRNGRPALLTASHAELDRVRHLLTLRSARYVSAGAGARERPSQQQTVDAAAMVVRLREGSGLERMEGSGGVRLATEAGTVTAPAAVLEISGAGRPERLRMSGGLSFRSGDEAGGMEGRAADGLAQFDARGAVQGVHLAGAVQAQSRGGSGGPTRTLSGHAMDLLLAGIGGDRRSIEQATLTGEARIASSSQRVPGTQSSSTDEVRADTLVAHWRQEGGTPVLQEVTGEGHTELRRAAEGLHEVSRGDHLQAEFAASARSRSLPEAARAMRAHVAGGSTAARRSGARRETVIGTVQRGNVTIEREARTRGGAMTPMRAAAEEARYDAGADHVTLLGDVEVSDPAGLVRAQRVVVAESTGDAEATGAVQATYRQAARTSIGAGAQPTPTAEQGVPMHAVAARAVLTRASGTITFFGDANAAARLWQGGSQVEAPVLVLAQTSGTLDAYGARSSQTMPVRTALANARADASAAPPADSPQPRRASRAAVLRVESGRLHYTDTLRRAEFSEGVLLEDASGTIRSRHAVATLRATPIRAGLAAVPAAPQAQHTTSFGLLGTGVDRVEATGDVVIHQPGRVATGAEAVYTSADGLFVLSGDAKAAPQVIDDVTGTVSGATLRFHAGDNSVVVDGRAKDGSPTLGDGRVHTRTRVKQ